MQQRFSFLCLVISCLFSASVKGVVPPQDQAQATPLAQHQAEKAWPLTMLPALAPFPPTPDKGKHDGWDAAYFRAFDATIQHLKQQLETVNGTSKTQKKTQRTAFYKTAWPCLKRLSDGLAARMRYSYKDLQEYKDIFPALSRKDAFFLLLDETLEKKETPAWQAFLGTDDASDSENTWPHLCAGEQMIGGVSLCDLDAVFLNLLRMQFFYAANTKHTLRAWHDCFKVFAAQNPLPKRDVVFALCQFIIEEQLSKVIEGIQRIRRIAKEDPTLDDYIAQRANASKTSALSDPVQPSDQVATTPKDTTPRDTESEAAANLVTEDQPTPEEATAFLTEADVAEQERAIQMFKDHQLALQLSEQFAAEDQESATEDQERTTKEGSKKKPKKRRKKKNRGRKRP